MNIAKAVHLALSMEKQSEALDLPGRQLHVQS